jgi:hypothetical protein
MSANIQDILTKSVLLPFLTPYKAFCTKIVSVDITNTILVIPSTYSLAPQIKMITESVTACNERFLGIIFFLSHF